MKFPGFLDIPAPAHQKSRRPSRRGGMLAIAATTLFLGLSFSAQATPVVQITPIYIYTSTGYDDVSSEVETIDGHTYVMTDTPYEIVLDYIMGHVYDYDGHTIGFIPLQPSP